MIIGAHLPVRDRGALAKLTLELESAELRQKAERAARAEAPYPSPGFSGGMGPEDPGAIQIARLEASIGTLIKSHLSRFNSTVRGTLRVYLLEMYERSYISSEDVSLIEASMRESVAAAGGVLKPALFYDSLGLRRPKNLPASPGQAKESLRKEMEVRWLEVLSEYSPDIFLDGTDKLIFAIAATGINMKVPRETAAALREKRTGLLEFYRTAPDCARLLRPESLFRRNDFTGDEKRILKDFFVSTRIFGKEDWIRLIKDDTVKVLLETRIPGLEVLDTRGRLKISGSIGLAWGEFLEDIERLIQVHRTRTETQYSMPSFSAAPPEAKDPENSNISKKALSDGRVIADRVMAHLSREPQESVPPSRLPVLEVFNNRVAGRIFLTEERYQAFNPALTTFMERLYREVDAVVREALRGTRNLGPTDRIVIREPARDILRDERVLGRILTIYLEGVDESGFPYLREIETAEAAWAYARAFWLLTQGSEPDISEEAVFDWSWIHGQTVLPLRLSMKLRTGPETLAGHLSSHREDTIGEYPDYHKAFIDLARELAYPWFKRSYRMTFPLLTEEYRARGFEGLLTARTIVRRISGENDIAISAGSAIRSPEGEWVQEVLHDLRDLKISVPEAEARLKSGADLFETVDRYVQLLGKEIELSETARRRFGAYEEFRILRNIEDLSPPYFSVKGADILRNLNDSLERHGISGASFLVLRELVNKRVEELFAHFSGEGELKKWRSDLFTAGLIGGRELSEWGRP